MANTTADKLALLEDTKAAMKSAINGSGSTVGDVFSAYPAAITSGKAAIAQATTNKGVATASTDTFAQMAANIEQIETGGVQSYSIDDPNGYFPSSASAGSFVNGSFNFSDRPPGNVVKTLSGENIPYYSNVSGSQMDVTFVMPAQDVQIVI